MHIDLSWASITLGMSRLKVVDQTDIPVPFDFREDVSIALAYNGEIYNWRELRASLGRLEWRTECDAELLAWLWRTRGGPKCLDMLNGMFAFVLVDVSKNEVFLVRDRAGEKPLYWTERGGTVYAASEPKALPVRLTQGACPDMDVLEFDCGKTTPFDRVYALEPGMLLQLDSIRTGGATRGIAPIEQRRWWQLPTEPPAKKLDERTFWESLVELEDTFKDAVRLRHVSERKVAIQLSGGLDSAMTQVIARCNSPYCVTFGEELDNLTAAELAAGREQVIPVTFDKDELLDVLLKVAYYLDTPATWTAVCQWFLNKRIAEDGGVVVLSGEGADELFGGYSRYRVLHWLDVMLADPHLKTYAPLVKRTFGGEPGSLLAGMLDRSCGESRARAEYLVTAHGGHGTLVDRMARTDFYTTMQALVRMADRMSAAFGLENRSPFFDYRLMELATRIPSANKVTKAESKAILRRAASRLGVNPAIINEETKRGLTVPASWGNGHWDRTWFASAMTDAWRLACLRPALCESCEVCA
jgi:asparagine synthase (glutamine-hydrolysing)